MNQKRYRILYVERPTATVGGSVISLYQLVRGLDTNVYEPFVLFYGPSAYQERFQALGVETIILNEQFGLSSIPQSIGPKRDIAARLNRYGDGLVAAYRIGKEAYLITKKEWPIARRVARLLKDKRIDLVHNNTSLPGNRATAIAALLTGVPQICHIRVLKRFSIFERYLARSVDSFIYISTAVEQLYRNLGIPTSKGQVIYNPVDTKTFEQANHTAKLRTEFNLTEQDCLISNVGRLSWWKGQDYFLEAMAQVVQSHPNVKVLIVGAPDLEPRDQAYYQRLRQLVIDLQLSSHVIFTGFRTDIPRIMAASDIVVHSASEPEPLGRVVIEAMAAGRPVVATAAGGVLDIIENGITGLLVPPKDASLMAKAIQKLLQNQEHAKIMGQRAQRHVKERFSVEQHVAAVQRLYQKILVL